MDSGENHPAPMTRRRSQDILENRENQLAGWNRSQANQIQPVLVPPRRRRVTFDPAILFLDSCKNEQFFEMQELLNNGVNVNTVNGATGKTALHEACMEGKFQLVPFLIAYGADVNCRDCHDVTPLQLAVTYDHDLILQILLENGADLSIILQGNCPSDISSEMEAEGFNEASTSGSPGPTSNKDPKKKAKKSKIQKKKAPADDSPGDKKKKKA